jgi:hypothetical protein
MHFLCIPASVVRDAGLKGIDANISSKDWVYIDPWMQEKSIFAFGIMHQGHYAPHFPEESSEHRSRR